MNLRSLNRGDAAVAVGALLLLISSFLPFYSYKQSSVCGNECSTSAWNGGLLPILAGVFLAGIIGAALVLLSRSERNPLQNRQFAGLGLGQWGTALSVFSIWVGLWSLFSDGGGFFAGLKNYNSSDLGHGAGAYLSFLSVLLIGVGAVATPLVSALRAPMLPARPAAPAAGSGQNAGLWTPEAAGYPGAQSGQPGNQQQGTPYGYPGTPQGGSAQQQWGAAQPAQGQPQEAAFGAGLQAGGPAAVSSAAADFAPFWFAVPAARQLAPEDNPAGAPVGELSPGTWYLAVEQRGTALVAQLQDGRRGLLSDTSGIQRG